MIDYPWDWFVAAIEDAVAADEIFSILMGDDVPPRKKFIQVNATQATLDV